MTFVVDFIALGSPVEEVRSSAGWIVIAIVWSIIGSLWLAGNLSSLRNASQSRPNLDASVPGHIKNTTKHINTLR